MKKTIGTAIGKPLRIIDNKLGETDVRGSDKRNGKARPSASHSESLTS